MARDKDASEPSINAGSEPKQLSELEPKQEPNQIRNPEPSQSQLVSPGNNPTSGDLIEHLIPANEVHLIGGPSGAGKTTLLFQTLQDFSRGEPVFGFPSHPQPFVYVPCDRSKKSTTRTLRRIGIEIEIPTFSLVDNQIPNTAKHILENARKLIPNVSLLVIDAIATLVPQGKISDYGVVAGFLRELSRFCQREKVTIIGVGHSTKTKEGEKFSNPRQRFLGSVAWGGFAETMILIEPEDAEDSNNTGRTVILLPRNSAEQHLSYHLDDSGRLINSDIDDAKFLFEQSILNLKAGDPYSTDSLLSMASPGVIKRTVERWLQEMLEKGLLERIKKGVYRRPHQN